MAPLPQTAAVEDAGARLRSTAERVNETKTAYDLAVEQRNRAVVDAVDGGMVQSAVARLAGISQPHVVRILSRSQPDALAGV